MGYTFQLLPPGVFTRVTTREDPAAEGGTVGEKCPVILPKLPIYALRLGFFLHAVKLRHGTDGFTSPPEEGVQRIFFFRPKNPTTSAGCEPANLGTKGQHATSRPPKPLDQVVTSTIDLSSTPADLQARWNIVL